MDFLRRAEVGEAEAEIRFPVRFWPLPVRRRVTVTFGLHLDVAEDGRRHDEIHVCWSAGTPLLPDFRGTLRFRIAGAGTTVLIEGSYAIPLGVLGRLFDGVAGRHIARGSIGDLTRRIADALERKERAWRAAHPVPLE